MKRLFTFMLVLGLLCGMLPASASGAEASDQPLDSAYLLYDLGLFQGTGNRSDGTPEFDLDRAPIRYEAVTMLVRLLGKEAEAKAGTWETPFTDVDAWAAPYVGYAYANGLTNGTGPTTFGGSTTVSAAQYITFVLRALGYSSSTDFRWDAPWELSDQIGLTDGSFGPEANAMTRGLAAVVSADALEVGLKDSPDKLCDKLMDEAVFTSDQYARATSGDAVQEHPISIDAFINDLNAEHKKATQYRYSPSFVAPYTKSFTDTLDLVSKEEALATMKRSGKWVDTCTKAEALADMDLLFRLYRAYYAAYDYFGGLSRFTQAQQEVTDWIAACPDDSVSVQALQETLAYALSFLQDGHLQIGGRKTIWVLDFTHQVIYDYYVKDLFLYEDTEGYYARLNGSKWYLSAVGSDTAIKEYLRVSIDEKGELCYIVCFSGNTISETLNVDRLTFRRGERTILYPMEWTQFTSRDLNNKDYYQTVSSLDGITLVEVMDDGENQEHAEEVPKKLLEIGRKIRNDDIVIFDVFTTYDYDQLIRPRGFKTYSELRNFKASKVAEYIGRTRIMSEDITYGKYTTEILIGRWVSDDGYKFVIQDKKWNGSGMENYIDSFKTMENSIFVGGRSKGLMVCGGCYHFWLPNTQLSVAFGMNMMFNMGATESIDGIGYEPDIWVDPIHATDAIVRLCKFYDL